MVKSNHAPSDAQIPDDDNRYTIEVQMTGLSDEDTRQPMAEGIITLRDASGQEIFQSEFLSGGWGKHEESWIPGLNRDNCDLVSYELDWSSFAFEERMSNEGFNGPDGTGSWLRIVSPRHMTERGGSELGGNPWGYFGIHTDGRVPGSEGCIALEDEKSEELFAILDDLRKNRPDERPLRVHVLPPQDNFMPPKVDPEQHPGISMRQIANMQQMGCVSRLREEFNRIDDVENTVHDDFSMSANRAATLLFLDQEHGINQQTMLGIWEMNSKKGNPSALSQGNSNWGMSDTQFATALLRHGPEMHKNVQSLVENSDIQYEANDVRAFSVVLRNYMARETGMSITEPLDSPEADKYFVGLEIPEDMFTDPQKIAFLQQELNYRRYHEQVPDGESNNLVGRLVETDGFTPEQNQVERYRLLSDLPLAEAAAMTSSLLATAEEAGIDPMSSFSAGRLYAAYQDGGTHMNSENAVGYQRRIDTGANTGMAYARPLITDEIARNVQADMRDNPDSNPYDRMQTTFIEAGIYSRMDEIREIVSTPLAARPAQTQSYMDMIGGGVDLNDLPYVNLEVSGRESLENPPPRNADFEF